MTTSETASEPRPLSADFGKERGRYAVTSILLLCWELGYQVTGFSYAWLLQAPLLLLACHFYFAFRTTIEWLKSDPRRRKLPVSRIDFSFSHSLGAAPVLVYLVQRILDLQLADKLHGPQGAFAILGILLAALGGFYATYTLVLFLRKEPRLQRFLLYGGTGAFLLLFLLLLASVLEPIDYLAVFIAFSLGASITLLMHQRGFRF